MCGHVNATGHTHIACLAGLDAKTQKAAREVVLDNSFKALRL
jgi:hypothetical protein